MVSQIASSDQFLNSSIENAGGRRSREMNDQRLSGGYSMSSCCWCSLSASAGIGRDLVPLEGFSIDHCILESLLGYEGIKNVYLA